MDIVIVNTNQEKMRERRRATHRGRVLKRQVSHVELFGEDSDSEGRAKVEVYLVLRFLSLCLQNFTFTCPSTFKEAANI